LAIEDIADAETKKRASARFLKVRCYNFCNVTSIIRIISVFAVIICFSVAFSIDHINQDLKWSLVGIGGAAAAFLFYSCIFGLAFSPLFGCNMKYSFCTFCEPRDVTFEQDYKEYMKYTYENKPGQSISSVQLNTNQPPQEYVETVPTAPLFAEPNIYVPMQPPPVEIKF